MRKEPSCGIGVLTGMTLIHPNHDRDHPPQMPWTFPVIAGTAVALVVVMALLERMIS